MTPVPLAAPAPAPTAKAPVSAAAPAETAAVPTDAARAFAALLEGGDLAADLTDAEGEGAEMLPAAEAVEVEAETDAAVPETQDAIAVEVETTPPAEAKAAVQPQPVAPLPVDTVETQIVDDAPASIVIPTTTAHTRERPAFERTPWGGVAPVLRRATPEAPAQPETPRLAAPQAATAPSVAPQVAPPPAPAQQAIPAVAAPDAPIPDPALRTPPPPEAMTRPAAEAPPPPAMPTPAAPLAVPVADPTLEVRAAPAAEPARAPEVPVPMRELPQTLTARAQATAATLPPGGEARTEITLSPPELGRVTLTIRAADDGALIVQVAADRPETMDLARRHSDAFDRAAAEAQLRMRLDLGGEGARQDRAASGGTGTAAAGVTAPVEDVAPPPIQAAAPGRLDLRL